ncbi:ATP-binding cassette domain-containing protein [Actinoplanes utahensis]|uniref:ATP-binding cassette domain-containing protein n=1 Tax=Actinoplanes utahensis TaxID=1869 RepID=UPI001F022D4B|nr:ATP-binding cassette domain-containing protein [Actinoplanes utahensis]
MPGPEQTGTPRSEQAATPRAARVVKGPIDPRLLRHARASRTGIALLTLIGIGQAAATVAIALALTWIVAGSGLLPGAVPGDLAAGFVPGGGTGAPPAGIVLLAGAFAVRGLLAWAEQVVAQRTAARVTDELRRSLLDRIVRRGPAWVAAFGAGRLSNILGTGLEALRPWFSGYLPALILGVLLPPIVVVIMAVVDPASATIALFTLPLIPLLGALIGWATKARAEQRWAADARLAGHFLDVVRGLATLRMYGRAERQIDVIADLTDRHRTATLRVLRVAFLSSTALDLVGTLSVGLIAVQAGLRVAAGTMDLGPALLVILLAPEAYRPLREMAARYHASTDAGAVITDVDTILTDGPVASSDPIAANRPSAAVHLAATGDRTAAGDSSASDEPAVTAYLPFTDYPAPMGGGATDRDCLPAGGQAGHRVTSGWLSRLFRSRRDSRDDQPESPGRLSPPAQPARGTTESRPGRSTVARAVPMGHAMQDSAAAQTVPLSHATQDSAAAQTVPISHATQDDEWGRDSFGPEAKGVDAECAPNGGGMNGLEIARRRRALRQVFGTDGRWGVRVVGLRASYPGASGDAVRLDELGVRAGELVALRGVSGAGKTTALRVLAGLHPAEAGAIAVGSTFHLPQRSSLPHARTVAEAFPPGTGRDDVRTALRLAGLATEVSPETPLGEHVTGISAGQRQRLALAVLLHRAGRALTGCRDRATAPVVTLLLDEPTAHLDLATELSIIDRLREFAALGCAILVVAHRPALLAAADRVVDLYPPTGGILQFGSSTADGRPVSRTVTVTVHPDGEQPSWAALDSAHRLAGPFNGTPAPTGTAIPGPTHRAAEALPPAEAGFVAAASTEAGFRAAASTEAGAEADAAAGAGAEADGAAGAGAEADGAAGAGAEADGAAGAGIRTSATIGARAEAGIDAEVGTGAGAASKARAQARIGTEAQARAEAGSEAQAQTGDEADAPAVIEADARAGAGAERRSGGGTRRGWLRRPGTAVVLGAGSSLAGIMLTGAAAWLLVRASSLPPVLSLSAAVVLVRGSAVARPLLRYLERLVAHDVAFARLGRRRARVYADLIPHVPGPRLHRRGDLLTRLVDDVDARVDGLLRGRLPTVAAAVTAGTCLAAVAWFVPAVAVPLAFGLLVTGVLAPAVAAWQADRQEAATGTARAELRDAMVETVDGVEELAGGGGRPGVPQRRSRTLADLEARAARAAGLAAAIAHVGWGVAVAGVAVILAGGALSAEWSAVALLGTVVLGEAVVALPEAAIARRRAAGAERRVATLTAADEHDPAVATDRAAAIDKGASAGDRDATVVGGDAEMNRNPYTGTRTVAEEEERTEPRAGEKERTGWGADGTEGTGSGAAPVGRRSRRAGDGPDEQPCRVHGDPGGLAGVRVSGLVADWGPGRGAVLDGLDLRLPAGSRTAVVGRSGCGKSTLAAVLAGLLEPRAGTVRSGGRTVLVGDETGHVFASTVRENLRLAAPTASDDRLLAVLRRVGLGGLALDTWLGTGGSTISGGQRRRLATARALLAEPDLLILDEPTEGLDEAGATELMADLLDAASGRTVLVLAHRREGLDLVDRTLVLDGGTLHEHGGS